MIKFKKILEQVLKKISNLSPREAYNLALRTGKRNQKLEKIIMKDPEWAYWYACNVIKGRWLEAEPIIMKNPGWVCWYALNVIRGRWKEAEPVIKQDEYWWNRYKKIF